jgi:hypothetical protein
LYKAKGMSAQCERFKHLHPCCPRYHFVDVTEAQIQHPIETAPGGIEIGTELSSGRFNPVQNVVVFVVRIHRLTPETENDRHKDPHLCFVFRIQQQRTSW